MNALLGLALLLTAASPVETSPTRSTRLYVRTLPPGAEVQVDGQVVGRSDGLFLLPPGVHHLTAELDGFDGQMRQVEIVGGRITRLELTFQPQTADVAETGPNLRMPPGDPFAVDEPTPIESVGGDRVSLSYPETAEFANESRLVSLDRGVAVRFQRPAESNQLLAVEVRLFLPAVPTEEQPQLMVLDGYLNVLRSVEVPRHPAEGGGVKWVTIPLERTEVPEQFFIALKNLNPQPRQGSYGPSVPEEPQRLLVGLARQKSPSHSYFGVPETGLTGWEERWDLMIRAVLAPPPPVARVR